MKREACNAINLNAKPKNAFSPCHRHDQLTEKSRISSACLKIQELGRHSRHPSRLTKPSRQKIRMQSRPEPVSIEMPKRTIKTTYMKNKIRRSPSKTRPWSTLKSTTQKAFTAKTLLLVTIISTINLPAFGQFIEYWNTNLGELQLIRNEHDHYSGSLGTKRIYGTRRSRNGELQGHWTGGAQDSPRCKYEVANSYYWGKITMTFTDQNVSGKYGSCDNPLSISIAGSLKMTSAGGSNIDLTGFFNPAFDKAFNTTHGILRFQSTNGNYNSGEYGNGYGILKLTQAFWRPRPRQEHEIHGTFTNTDGGTGQFVFNFKTPCSFTGQWWFHNQSHSKRQWDGICRQ